MSDLVDENLLTRSLSGNMEEDVTQEDLDVAIKVMSKKCLIGLYTRLNEFMSRLDQLIRWQKHMSEEMMQCRHTILTTAYDDYMKSMYPTEGSDLWKALEDKNKFDIQLFQFAEELFDDQSRLNFRLKKKIRWGWNSKNT